MATPEFAIYLPVKDGKLARVPTGGGAVHRVLSELGHHPPANEAHRGLTARQLAEETGYRQKTVRQVLEELSARKEINLIEIGDGRDEYDGEIFYSIGRVK